MDRCEECGFEYDLSEARRVGQSIVEGIAEFAVILRARDVDVAARPQPSTWSPLEYGCHLRDVLLVQRERVLAARRADRPSFDPMGRDERVEHDGYAEQDPDDVARQLTDAAQMFANVLNRLGPDQMGPDQMGPDQMGTDQMGTDQMGTDEWDRSVMYNYPQRSERSLRWVAVHTLHEIHHHLLDVRRQLV
jgi:DinB superfamily